MKVIILLTVSAVLYTVATGVPDPMRPGAVAGIECIS